MGTSAPARRRHSGGRPAEHVPRPDRGDDVRWAWGLIAVTLPAAVVAVLLVEVAGATGTVAGLLVYLAVAAPLAGSVAVGLRAWRRRRDGLGLRAALMSAGMLVVSTALVAVTGW